MNKNVIFSYLLRKEIDNNGAKGEFNKLPSNKVESDKLSAESVPIPSARLNICFWVVRNESVTAINRK